MKSLSEIYGVPYATTQMDECRAVTASESGRDSCKWFSPWSFDQIMAEAAAAVIHIERNIDRFDSMTDAQLARAAPEIWHCQDRIREQFLRGPPDGMRHEPHVLAYEEWSSNHHNASGQFSELVRGIPREGFKRFAAIVARLPTVEIEQRAIKQKSAPGGHAKAANSPLSAAKETATQLWPEAHRKGWSSERLWTALRDKGHAVKPDTVRKWMTKLRKTGSC